MGRPRSSGGERTEPISPRRSLLCSGTAFHAAYEVKATTDPEDLVALNIKSDTISSCPILPRHDAWDGKERPRKEVSIWWGQAEGTEKPTRTASLQSRSLLYACGFKCENKRFQSLVRSGASCKAWRVLPGPTGVLTTLLLSRLREGFHIPLQHTQPFTPQQSGEKGSPEQNSSVTPSPSSGASDSEVQAKSQAMCLDNLESSSRF